MKAKQKRKAITVLKKGCEIKDRLCNEHGEHCALGSLLSAAGVPDEQLQRGSPNCEQKDILYHVYGLEAVVQDRIMDANDSVHDRKLRIKKVVNLIERLFLRQKPAE